MILLWSQFALVTLVIVFAGYYLSTYGDAITEKTGMGRTWVGVILMASVTSLPELITIFPVSFAAVYRDLPRLVFQPAAAIARRPE